MSLEKHYDAAHEAADARIRRWFEDNPTLSPYAQAPTGLLAVAACNAFLSSLADDPPEEMVRAASDAIYEMTRGAKLPGVVNGLQTDHVGSIPLAGLALSAALREAVKDPASEDAGTA